MNSAIRQFARLEQRLNRAPELHKAYHEFMRDYLKSGHMELMPSPSDGHSYEPYDVECNITPYIVPMIPHLKFGLSSTSPAQLQMEGL